MGGFPFQNNPKNLDPSYKMDVDFWDCFLKGQNHLIAEFHKTDLVICQMYFCSLFSYF